MNAVAGACCAAGAALSALTTIANEATVIAIATMTVIPRMGALSRIMRNLLFSQRFINCRVDTDRSDGVGNITLLASRIELREIRGLRWTHRRIDVVYATLQP
jgi:hypothetical protein